MKNYFKLMSLLLGMVLCSAAFVACGDDDDDGQYAGNRLIGEWVWGEPNQNQQEMQHHQRGYIFNADGTMQMRYAPAPEQGLTEFLQLYFPEEIEEDQNPLFYNRNKQ